MASGVKNKSALISEIIILSWPIVAPLLCLFFHANFFYSTVIFSVVPSVCLSIMNPPYIKKAALFSAIFFLYGLVIDYIMEVAGGWAIPHSIFGSYRFLGVVTPDILIWSYCYVYFVVMFYEVFLHHHCCPKLYYPKFKYLIIFTFVLLGTFMLLYFLNPGVLKISYFYLILGLFFGMTPIIFMFLRVPKIYTKLTKAGAYFFFFNFSWEIIALKLGQWTFPDKKQFLGLVTVGQLTFPLEEFIFWIMLGVLTILSLYEFYDDAWD